MPTTTDWSDEKKEGVEKSGGSVEKKKEWRKELAATHAEIPGSSGVNIRQCRRNLMRENGQTSQQRARSFIYLLLDIAVGNWNRTWGSVDEVLVGGDLIGLHRSCCTV